MDDSHQSLQEAIERNGVAHTLYWCQWSQMQVVEHPHAIVTESLLPCPFFNNVFSASFPNGEQARHVEELVDRFRRAKVPLFWWSGPVVRDRDLNKHLLANGLFKAFEAPAMAKSLKHPLEKLKDSICVEEITDTDNIKEWSLVCASAFEFDSQMAEWWCDLYSSLPFGTGTPLRHYVARVDGKPVATASAFRTDDTVGVASIGVIPAHRRRGIGTAITLRALNNAQQQGCDLAVLFSSEMAKAMYEKIGFVQYGNGECYLSPSE
ncbi:GNAT family N-acetyltransferase [Thalassoglobus sp. JC818]|uniref:GNAT family N-acetyltransferase n=1 Tax=Thalassoglobus sp. JC818 TaxID=3232136 RepID=UPI0034593403